MGRGMTMSVTRCSLKGRGESLSKPGARRKGRENAVPGRPRGWRRGGVWRPEASGAESELLQSPTRAPDGARGVDRSDVEPGNQASSRPGTIAKETTPSGLGASVPGSHAASAHGRHADRHGPAPQRAGRGLGLGLSGDDLLFEATVEPLPSIAHDRATTVGPFVEMQNGARATVGPFVETQNGPRATVRPFVETRNGARVTVGPFVEMWNGAQATVGPSTWQRARELQSTLHRRSAAPAPASAPASVAEAVGVGGQYGAVLPEAESLLSDGAKRRDMGSVPACRQRRRDGRCYRRVARTLVGRAAIEPEGAPLAPGRHFATASPLDADATTSIPWRIRDSLPDSYVVTTLA